MTEGIDGDRAFLAGGGGAARLIGELDWSATDLGPISSWPQSLKTATAMVLNSPVPIVMLWGPDGRMIYNDAYSRFAGARHPSLLGSKVLEGWPEVADLNAHVMAEGLAGRTLSYRDMELTLSRNGSPEKLWANLDYSPVPGEDGRPAGVIAIVVETTERVRSEREIRDLNADLERRVIERSGERGLLWQVTQDLLGVMNERGVLEISNPAWGTVLGWSAEELASVPLFSLVHPEDVRATESARVALRSGRPVLDFENRYRRKDGGWTWLSWVAVPEGGKVYARARDVTADKLRAAELADSTAELDRIWRNSRDLQVVLAADGVFRHVNPAWTEILGWTEAELVGHHYSEFVHEDSAEDTAGALEEATSDRDLSNFVNLYRHKDGTTRWISWQSSFENGLAYVSGRDVTEAKEQATALTTAQDALRQAQKLDAMGQLTGGVAHDFNNLLTPIIGTFDMLIRRNVGSERERMLIEGGLQSADRAKTLVQRLLAFARRQPLQPTAVDVSSLVRGMSELVTSTLGPQIRVRIEAPDDVPAAVADANQIEMALLNLAVNARDAMVEGGDLVVTVARDTVGIGHRSGLRGGRYVRLSVRDTGHGMDAETAKRAIEPFFSTKGVGRGTGLGLSMVHGLAAQLGGAVALTTAPNRGTTVDLWLPESATEAPAVEIVAAPEVPKARGRALLVDDEALIRMSTADMLAEMGWDVVEASSAEQALKMVEDGLSYDILVTDHMMPGMTGTDLAMTLRMRTPDVPVLVVSGYSEHDGFIAEFPRLTKPFRQADLVASVASVTGAVQAAA